MNHKIFLLCAVLIFATVACNDSNEPKILEENLYQTWVLIEKNINNTKEVLPDNDHPITLIFYPTNKLRGRHDQNTYYGTFAIKQGDVAFDAITSTDGYGIPWYWNYIGDCSIGELIQTNKVSIFSQHNNPSNMQLQLSNQSGSVVLHFINKKWFEEAYFELKEGY